MSFLHFGLAMAGIACVSIPIIIHILMRRRRRPIMWGAMRFLLEAYQKHRRRLMLEKWLLLLARCLLIALIGMAIGRPLLGALGGGAGAGRTVYLLIDNGMTSGAVGDDGRPAIDRHKDAAKAVLRALHGDAGSAPAVGGAIGEGDRVALVCLGGPAEGLVLPASADVAAVSSLLDSVRPAESRTDLAGGLAMVASTIESEQRQHGGRKAAPLTFVVVLCDYLEGSAELGSALARLPEGVQLLSSTPSDAGQSNIAITGVEPERSVLITGPESAAAGSTSAPSAIGGNVRVMLRRSGPAVSRGAATTVQVAVRGSGTPAAAKPSTPGAGTPPGRAVVRWAPGQETATAAVQVANPGGTGRRDIEGTEVLEASLDGVVSTGGGDAVAADNLWRRPVEVRRSLRVGVVSPRRFGDRERVDRLDAGEWLRLALRPGDGSDIDVVDIEPASLDGARLAGLDAVILPRPDLVPEAAWARLRLFLDGGGLAIVMPPSQVSVHLWSDAMVRQLGVDWRLAREARVLDTPSKVAPTAAALGSADNPVAQESAESAGASSLLYHIRGDLAELGRAVNVSRTLPLQDDASGTAGGSGQRLLTLTEDGTTFLWAGSPSAPTDDRQPPTAPAPGSKPGAGGASTPQAGAPDSSAGRGLLVYIATAMELGWTDLPAKPLMVPLLQEIVKQGVGRAHGSWWAAAGTRPLAPSRSVELRAEPLGQPAKPGGRAGAADETIAAEETAIVPVDESGLAARPLRHAGLWRATDERGVTRGVLAINPDTRASRTDAQPRASVEQWLAAAGTDGKVTWLAEPGAVGSPDQPHGPGAVASIAAILARQGEQAPISLPLLIAALVIAVLELALARWASHADMGAARAGIRSGLTGATQGAAA